MQREPLDLEPSPLAAPYAPPTAGLADPADVDRLPATPPSAGPRANAAAGGRRRTVLIVDDSRTVRHLYTFALKAAGYDVLEAGDGPAGFELALRATPDLLLVDMLMPSLTGDRMLRALRLAEEGLGRPHAPALLLTALPTPPALDPSLGVRAVLDKGRLSSGDVVAAVRKALAASELH